MISVIIPTLNEENYLPILLNDLNNQTYKDFEIIVADANSKDKTREIAKEFGCIIVDGGMPGIARNAGAKVANGNYLMFFDSDVSIKSDFLEKTFNEFQNRYLEICSCDFISDRKRYDYLYTFYNHYVRYVQYFKPVSGGAFIFTTKRLFNHLNGFDENITHCEDHDLISRASKLVKFRLLNDVSVEVSSRRFLKTSFMDGLKSLIHAEVLKKIKGKITDDSIHYEFGNYDDLDDVKEKERRLHDFLKFKDSLKKLKSAINRRTKTKKDKSVKSKKYKTSNKKPKRKKRKLSK